MSKKFVGVAYWSGTLSEGWMEKVITTLQPVDGLKLVPGELGIEVGFKGNSFALVSTGDGKTQGVVYESPVAGVLLVCLIALARALGTLTIVDDAQADIPKTIRQSNPLYAGNWSDVSQVAEALGLVAGGKLAASHAGVFNRLI